MLLARPGVPSATATTVQDESRETEAVKGSASPKAARPTKLREEPDQTWDTCDDLDRRPDAETYPSHTVTEAERWFVTLKIKAVPASSVEFTAGAGGSNNRSIVIHSVTCEWRVCCTRRKRTRQSRRSMWTTAPYSGKDLRPLGGQADGRFQAWEAQITFLGAAL